MLETNGFIKKNCLKMFRMSKFINIANVRFLSLSTPSLTPFFLTVGNFETRSFTKKNFVL